MQHPMTAISTHRVANVLANLLQGACSCGLGNVQASTDVSLRCGSLDLHTSLELAQIQKQLTHFNLRP